MKRLSSSDSLGAMVSTSPSTDEKISRVTTNSKSSSKQGFQKNQSMLERLDQEEEEEEDCFEETGLRTEKKKRRLSVVQVKALEKNFEVENKLEPERKVKLAQELGLEPRQVAVWFQNRRARWKTKQLERDYGTLNANYESLKQDYEALQQTKDALVAELRELKSKLEQDQDQEQDQDLLSNEELYIKSEPEEPKITRQSEPTLSQDCCNKNAIGVLIFGDSKDGSSDSDDSSAVLNDEDTMNMNNNNPNAAISHQQFMSPPPLPSLASSSSSSINCFRFTEPDSISATTQKDFHNEHPFVRLEEHNFLGAEEPCNFFCDDQAPTLHWYCPDPWN